MRDDVLSYHTQHSFLCVFYHEPLRVLLISIALIVNTLRNWLSFFMWCFSSYLKINNFEQGNAAFFYAQIFVLIFVFILPDPSPKKIFLISQLWISFLLLNIRLENQFTLIVLCECFWRSECRIDERWERGDENLKLQSDLFLGRRTSIAHS